MVGLVSFFFLGTGVSLFTFTFTVALFSLIRFSDGSFTSTVILLDFLSWKSELHGLKYMSSAITSRFILPPSFNILNLGNSILQLPSLLMLPLNTKFKSLPSTITLAKA